MTFAILPDPPDDLTPPAEWLLQSARAGGQVTSEILAEALAYEHHAWLRRLGAALLPPESEPLPGEPRQRAPIPPSERLLCETLTAALGKVHAYDAGLGVRPWLAALAVQAITRRIQRLPPVPQSDDNAATLAGLDLPVAAAAALRLLCGFSRAELARIPGLPEDWLAGLSAALLPGAANAGDEPDPFQSDAPRSERALDGSISAGDNQPGGDSEPIYPWSRRNGAARPQPTAAPPAQELDPHEQRLADLLQRAYPAPPGLPPERLNALAAYAARRAGRRALIRRRRVAFNEIALISLAILAVMLVIWGADRLLPPEPDAPRATLPPATPINYNAGIRQYQATPRPSVTPWWRDHVAYVVQPGDTLESIARDSGVSQDELKRANREIETEPLYSGQVLWVRVPAYADPAARAAWVEPSERLDSRPEELASDATPAEILDRILASSSLWRTFWADYQMVYYGPQRYNAEPRAYRFQVWVSQPDRSLEIFNELSSLPEMRHITLQGRSYTSAIRYSGAYLDPDWNHDPSVLLTNPMLRETIFPGSAERFKETLRIEPEGTTLIAGRSALAVLFSEFSGDGAPLFRLWIDRRFGVILRRQQLEHATGVIVSDMIVTRLALDRAFPAALFNPLDPWEGGFAAGPGGDPSSYEHLPPTPTWALPGNR